MQKLLCFFVKRGIISIALSGRQCLHGFAGAQDLKSCGVKSVPVRSRSSAPKSRLKMQPGFFCFSACRFVNFAFCMRPFIDAAQIL